MGFLYFTDPIFARRRRLNLYPCQGGYEAVRTVVYVDLLVPQLFGGI